MVKQNLIYRSETQLDKSFHNKVVKLQEGSDIEHLQQMLTLK